MAAPQIIEGMSAIGSYIIAHHRKMHAGKAVNLFIHVNSQHISLDIGMNRRIVGRPFDVKIEAVGEAMGVFKGELIIGSHAHSFGRQSIMYGIQLHDHSALIFVLVLLQLIHAALDFL